MNIRSRGPGRHSEVAILVGLLQMEFLRPITVSILSERRAIEPFGLGGGSPGSRGINLLVRRDGRVVNIGSKSTFHVESGDRLRLLTPGTDLAWS